MTFENAQRITTQLSAEGIHDICMAANLDGILQHHDIDESFYRRCAAVALKKDRIDEGYQIAHEMVAEFAPQAAAKTTTRDYWPGFHAVGLQNPFDETSKHNAFSRPQPKHAWLKGYIEDFANNPEVTEDFLVHYAQRRAGLYITLDNALSMGKIVLGWDYVNTRHVFGIEKTNETTYNVIDSWAEDGVTSVEKFGPCTLRNLAGIHDDNMNDPATRPPARCRHRFTPIEFDDDEINGLLILPAEEIA